MIVQNNKGSGDQSYLESGQDEELVDDVADNDVTTGEMRVKRSLFATENGG